MAVNQCEFGETLSHPMLAQRCKWKFTKELWRMTGYGLLTFSNIFGDYASEGKFPICEF